LHQPSTDFHRYISVSTATSAPSWQNDFMQASPAPGLRIAFRLDVIGPRVLEIA
jgi:hypothetical protein